MASIDKKNIIGKLKGSFGKELVLREWDGKTIVSKFPKKASGKPSSAQAATREKFLIASKYAKSITSSIDQSIADAYVLALKPNQNVYSRAMEDFMITPEIKFINTGNYRGAIGDKIIIRAIDDFRVTEVRVEMYATDGTLLEAGHPLQNINGIDWTYTATRINTSIAGTTVKAIAKDIPGNKGIFEVTIR